MKASMDIKLFQRFLIYLRPYWRLVAISLVAIPVSVSTNILFPWLVIQIIDEKLVSGNPEGLYTMIGLLGGVLFLNYVADAIYTYSLQRVGQFTILDMRRELFRRILRLPRRYFDKTPIGVTLTRLTTDFEAVGESFAMGVLSMIKDSINTVALLIFLSWINWQLTLLLVFVLIPMYFIARYLRNRIRSFYNEIRRVQAAGTGFLQECLNGIATLQLYAAEKEVEKKYNEFNQKFYKAQIHSNNFDASLYSIVTGVTSISMGLVIWYGAGEVLAGVVSLGILIAFLNTLDKIFIPIRDFTSQIAAIQRAFSAFEHIDALFQHPLEEEHLSEQNADLIQSQLSEFKTLEFKNVRFRYTPDGPEVLKGISFTLNQGQKFALVGSTGSGKSTIIRLLTKTYEHYEGSIKVNGLELSDIPKALINHLSSLMQQDAFLFDEAIRFNIGLDREGLDDEAIEKAAEYVYANEFIEQLPGRYDFQIRDNGANLSAGQAQLLSFARSIADGSEIVLLDEATSSVDSVTEHLIQKAVDRVFQEKTVVAIAHRLSTIRHSDQILVLDQGLIEERGTHEQLMRQEGIYANLIKELEPSATEQEVA